MNCPYCQQEMRSGYLQNSVQPVQWIPAGGKPSIWMGEPAKDGVQLGDGTYFKGYTAKAHYCAKCGIVIVPVK